MHGPDGTDYPNQITWREVVPPERLTYLHAGDDGHTFESSIVLEERGGATLVTMRALFPTRAEREAVVERCADEGGEQTLGRLAALCEAQSGAGLAALGRKELRACRGFGSTHLQSPSMVTAPVPARVWTIRWASEEWRCTSGFSARGRSRRCTPTSPDR